MVDPGQGRPQRRGALSYDQFVVGLLELRVLLTIMDMHDALIAVDFDDLVTGAHVEIQLSCESFRGNKEQAITLGYVAADVIGKTTIRKRNILVSLEYDDLCIFVEASKPCRRGLRDSRASLPSSFPSRNSWSMPRRSTPRR